MSPRRPTHNFCYVFSHLIDCLYFEQRFTAGEISVTEPLRQLDTGKFALTHLVDVRGTR